jgi:O-antigen/teichoic acid export membrane protein
MGGVRLNAKPSKTESFGRQLLHHIVAFGLPAVLSVVSSSIFTRVFTPIQFGEYSVMVGLVSLMTSIAEQWLFQPIIRMLPSIPERETDQMLKAINLGLIIIWTITCSLVLTCSVLPLSTYIKEYMCVAAVMLLTQVTVDISSAVLRARLQTSFYSQIQVLIAVLRFTLSLALCWAVRSPFSLAWGTSLGAAAGVVPLLIRSGMLKNLRTMKFVDRSVWLILNRMFSYGLPMTGWFICSNILGTSDRLVIGLFSGTAQAGIYSANYSLVIGAVSLATTPIANAANPVLMNTWAKGDVPKTQRILSDIGTLMLSTGILLTGATLVFEEDLASLLLGKEFRSGSSIMSIVVAGGVAMAYANYAHKPFEFMLRTRLMMWLASIAAVLNLLLNVILVPIYGYIAAGWTTLLCYTLYAFLTTLLGRRLLPWHTRWSSLIFPLLCSCLGVIAAKSCSVWLAQVPLLLRMAEQFGIYVLISVCPVVLTSWRQVKGLVMTT